MLYIQSGVKGRDLPKGYQTYQTFILFCVHFHLQSESVLGVLGSIPTADDPLLTSMYMALYIEGGASLTPNLKNKSESVCQLYLCQIFLCLT